MRTDKADPGAHQTGISATACNPGHTRPSTEILDAGPGSTQRNAKTTQKTLSGRQKGRLSRTTTFNCKFGCHAEKAVVVARIDKRVEVLAKRSELVGRIWRSAPAPFRFVLGILMVLPILVFTVMSGSI
jgi:hypothetical protein